MTTPIFILVAILSFGLGCGVAIWSVFRHRQAVKRKEPTKKLAKALTFRWCYIILPLAILLLSVILTAYFYHQLPGEVAYHFKLDGSPDKWLSREMTVVWFLVPQFLLTLVAGGITWGITKLGLLFRQREGIGIKPERIVSLMGNMIALPQIILCFAMLSIFSYNSYQIHLIPIWVFALIIMGVGGIILGIFFIRALRQTREAA